MPAGSHTEPLFKKLHMLKVEDILKLNQLKFFYKFIDKDLHDYFQSFPILRNSTIHNHSTRNQKLFHKKVITHEFAKKSLRNTLINTLNNCSERMLDKYIHIVSGDLQTMQKMILLMSIL